MRSCDVVRRGSRAAFEWMRSPPPRSASPSITGVIGWSDAASLDSLRPTITRPALLPLAFSVKLSRIDWTSSGRAYSSSPWHTSAKWNSCSLPIVPSSCQEHPDAEWLIRLRSRCLAART